MSWIKLEYSLSIGSANLLMAGINCLSLVLADVADVKLQNTHPLTETDACSRCVRPIHNCLSAGLCCTVAVEHSNNKHSNAGGSLQNAARYFLKVNQFCSACRARYCHGKSVQMSVCPMPVLCLNEWTSLHIFFWNSGRTIILVFLSPPLLQNFKGNSLSRGVKWKRRESFTNIAIYLGNGTS